MPLLIVTPLTFLGGSFYSIDMLPPFWQKVTLFNPVVYLISGMRWSFYEIADVNVCGQPRHDAGFPGCLPDGGVVDVPDRIPSEALTHKAHCPHVPPQLESRPSTRRGPTACERRRRQS